jgi:hypothetical protein
LLNSRFFIARAGLAPLDQLHATMGTLLPDRDQLAPGLGDQPFVNFWAEEAGLSVVSINAIAPELNRETWAGQPVETVGTSPFIHWAGFRAKPSMPRLDLFLEYRCRNRLTRAAWKVKAHGAAWSKQARTRARRAAGRVLRKRR